MRVSRLLAIVFLGLSVIPTACTGTGPPRIPPVTPVPVPVPAPVSAEYEVKWIKTFDGGGSKSASSVKQTSDGGFIIAGVVVSAALEQNIYILKTDPSGTMLWDKTYPGRTSSVQQTSDGGFIIAGYTLSSRYGFDGLLIKTDASGSMLWSNTYGSENNEFFYDIQQTSDGGFIMVGSTDYANSDIYLVKTDAKGAVLWSKNLGGIDYESASSVRQTSDGGYIVAGTTNSSSLGGMDAYLVKTNVNGTMLWSKNLGGKGYDSASSMGKTTDGGYIIAGTTNSSSLGGLDAYLVKTNANGTMLWSKNLGGTGRDSASSVQQTSDGGYIIVGETNSFGSGGYDSYFVKVDASGTPLWENTLNSDKENISHSVQQTTDGRFVVVGHIVSTAVGIKSDIYLACFGQQLDK